ncbi:hypothetical protein [Geobacter sp.]|uniref:hypothetical protein n=1 Tax=Geobacter sp. TaxID=46610 RepID=UPI001AD4E4F5|nr:hypothetical protein [Geobacter sp.]CAG0952095.1 hypothetical protein GEOBC_00253 [Geobacteraceae bacterium]
MIRKRHVSSLVMVVLLALLTGCATLGPGTIARDRFDYTTSVADSWKRQMLLNIVKIRYGDAPIFLDVASIINQYSLEGELNASFGWQFPTAGSNNQRVGGSGRYYDRPTITYTPLTGEKFARNLMTPVAPATVMSLIEGGYPIDLVFRILVHSVNGIQNQFGGSARMRKADPEFYTLLEKLRQNQTAGNVALRVKKTEDRAALVMVFRKRVDKETEETAKEIRRILGLKESGGEFRVVYGSAPSNDEEIALLTRSIIEILSDISSTVEVPEEHVAEKRVPPTKEPEGEGIKGPMIRIFCSKAKPGDDFAAVPYRDRWFWIDDRDYQSKKLFSFLMFVMTLTETGGKEGAPIVTISAGG